MYMIKKTIDELMDTIYLKFIQHKFDITLIPIKDIYIDYIKHIYPDIQKYEPRKHISL